jgi:F-type H+-transporting ATPase subunit delta
MIGSSRESLAALRTSLDARRDEPGFDTVSGDLLAVAGLLGREKALRLALADSGQEAGVRGGVVRDLLGGKVGDTSLAVLEQVVSSRWSSDVDLVDAVEQLGAQAAFIGAERDGSLDRVEDELFRVGRAVDGSAALQMALTDPSVAGESKSALVRDLIGAEASPVTTSLVAYAAANLRGRQPAIAIEALATLAADQRRRLLAEVRTAVALSDDQSRRLAAALSKQQGRDVRLNVIVDPTVVGGVVVRVGDDVIDGSVASRLEQAGRAVSA